METLSQSHTQSWLSWFFRGILILGFLVLVARLTDLQVIRGAYFKELAEGNRVRRVPIVAPRGKMLARGGETLVGNKEVKKRILFDPIDGYEKSSDIQGADRENLITEYVRSYQLASGFAHTSGYLGRADESESEKINAECTDKGPRRVDALVGRTGLEQEYECLLSGINGEELVEVDSYGNRVRTLGRLSSTPGNDLQTTIDYGLQEHIAQIVSGEKEFDRGEVPEGELASAIVVSDTKGEILAIYSSPSFDPNVFIRENNRVDVEKILNDERLPLVNRATSGAFPPGSVFKPIVAIAALEEDAINDKFTYDDTGSIVLETSYGIFTYSNWYMTQYGKTEGVIDLPKALARSTDTFFYKVGEHTGINAMTRWSEKFGYGLPTGIDIPGEVSGLVPNPEWKRLAKAERWFLGNTYHFAIGQGDMAATVLQVNQSIAAIANRGVYCKPRLTKDLPGGSECEDLGIDRDNLDLVIEGMVRACTSGGTGFTFFEVNDPENDKFKSKRVACKTGTAESGGDDKPHAWFTFFGPVSTGEGGKAFPEIVVTVLVENGGEGSKIAGPIAREIYNYWFEKENKN